MKKILLAVILLIILVAVAYLKAKRDQAQKEEFFRQGYQSSADVSKSQTQQIDSLSKLLGGTRTSYEDSLATQGELYVHQVDSLEALLDSNQGRITQLQKQLVDTNNDTEENTIKKKLEAKRHREILDYYKQSVTKLPKDLSAYERRVAISEIRTVTAMHFSITVTRLNDIRSRNSIDY